MFEAAKNIKKKKKHRLLAFGYLQDGDTKKLIDDLKIKIIISSSLHTALTRCLGRKLKTLTKSQKENDLIYLYLLIRL